MDKKTVAVLFGGVSSEHDISCISATGILSNIDRTKYDIIMLGITKQGEWYLFDGDVSLIKNDKWLSKATRKAYIVPDSSTGGIVLDDCSIIKVDVVFPVLHGKNGEDGTVQGLLQLAQIPFVGCNATASDICMDKSITNAIADTFGIDQAKWCFFTRNEYKTNPEKLIDNAEKKLGYPIFVKPCAAGSSVGISKAHDRSELKDGIELALKEDKKVLLEEFIDGFEVECAVLGNDEPITSDVGQIISAAEFYDFDSKYNNPVSELHIPALIEPEKRLEVRAAALKVYKAMGCEGMSRCDFFVTKKGGRVLFNEINTIPGQTPISMYPKLFEAAGIPYAKLIDKLIELALERSTNY